MLTTCKDREKKKGFKQSLNSFFFRRLLIKRTLCTKSERHRQRGEDKSPHRAAEEEKHTTSLLLSVKPAIMT